MKYIDMLGYRAKDRITGFEGTITSICFDLFGCIQATINPGLDKDGKFRDSAWFDINRLEFISKKRVMEPPNFEDGYQAEAKQGAADKPINYRY